MDILTRLSGFKTYIVVALTALVTLFSTLHGAVAPSQAIIAVLVALSVAFARAGSKTDAIRGAAIVVREIAPLVTPLVPAAAAPLVRAVGAISEGVSTELADAAAPVVIPAAAKVTDPEPLIAAAPAEPIAPIAQVPSPDLVEAVVAAVVARLSGAAPAVV